MANQVRVGIAVFMLGVLVLAGGCRRTELPPASPDAQQRVESMETTAVAYPKLTTSVEGSAPVLAFREYAVPEGGELEGYGNRFATIKYNMTAAGEPTTLRLLDFTTGTSKQAVAGATNFKNGYNIVGVSGGDRWIAWEELNGGEGVSESDDPPMWKLYAVKIDAKTMTCGTPVLVEEGVLDTTSRPLFRVEGDALYWMTNTVAGGRPVESAGGAIVKARDLTSGSDRTVCETDRHYASMSVGDGQVVVAEQGNGSERTVVRLFDPASGKETWSLDLNNTEFISHFPQVHNGCVAWTLFAPGGLGCPDLFYRGTDGVTRRVRDTAADPTPVGRYLFYDGLRTVSRGTGLSETLDIIGGYDTVTNERFTILDGEEVADAGWDMPMGRGYSPDTFVISSGSKPDTANVADYSKYPMRIRRYTVPAK